MSDRQPPLWNIRSSDDKDDNDPATSYGKRSSNPFYKADDDDYEDEDYDEGDADAEDNAYGSSGKPYGSSRYGGGTSSTPTAGRSPSGSDSAFGSGSSPSVYGGKSPSTYGGSSVPGGSSAPRSGGYTSPSSTTGSSASYTRTVPATGAKKEAGEGKSGGGLLGRFGGEKKTGGAAPTKRAASGGSLGARLSGGLTGLRNRLPSGGSKPGAGSSASRASTTRTLGSPGGEYSGPERKSEKKERGRSGFSLPFFGKGKSGSSRKKGPPSTPKGLKRAKPLPATSKRPQIKNEGLSLDLKLDLAGWGMLILAAIVFFGAISTNQGDVSRTLLELIYQLVGVGWLAIPLALAAAGIWLIWRHFGENVPELNFVHLVGWGVTYLAALTTFHFVHLFGAQVYTLDQLQVLSEEAARQGVAGGWVGGQFYIFLMRTLGDVGAFITLVGWWVIGIIVATDLSFAQIIRFLNRSRRNFVMRLKAAFASRTPITASTAAPLQPLTAMVELPSGAVQALNNPTSGRLALPGTETRALPAAETMPIPQQIDHNATQLSYQDQSVASAPLTRETGAYQPVIPPQPAQSASSAAPQRPVYTPPTPRHGATQFRMPSQKDVPVEPLPAAESGTAGAAAETSAPSFDADDLAVPVILPAGEDPVRIRRPQYASDAGDDGDLSELLDPLDDENTGSIEVIRSAQPSTSPATKAPVDDASEMDEVEAFDQPIVVTGHAADALAAHGETSEIDPEWLRPARPRFAGERVLRPLREPDPGLSAAVRAALDAFDTEDAAADDEADDVVYEDLPEIELGDDLDAIEIDESDDSTTDIDAADEVIAAIEPPIRPPTVPRPQPSTPVTAKPPAVAPVIPVTPPAPSRRTTAASSAEALEIAVPGLESAGQGSLLPPPVGTSTWVLPDFREILDPATEQNINDSVLLDRARIIEDTLASFGAPGKVVEVNPGPVITQFGVEPDYIDGRGGRRTRVKVQAIARLADDLALSLAARSIRIEAPVPGKGFVGIEVPNAETSLVSLRDVMESPEYANIDSKLRIGLGQSVDGTPVAADLTAMPHLLVAGTTGSGKSVCVNAIIACLLMQNTPDDLRFIMVDPKRVELTGYNGIPHLVAPVVVDLERIVGVLKWVTREMDDRYRKFNERGARNVLAYNNMLKPGETRLPYLVVVVDELADLMMLAPDETERVLTRLAQMARATGIHLIISTQRPSVDVVTGLIKANFPSRVAFAVASSVDSRVILDQPGAERLLGRGDMLFQAPNAAAPARLQGVYVSDAELNRLVSHWKGTRTAEPRPIVSHAEPPPPPVTPTARTIGPIQSRTEKYGPPSTNRSTGGDFWDHVAPRPETGPRPTENSDELYNEAVEVVRRLKKASVSLLQRQLRIGYTRAARLIDVMEENGVVGRAQSGSKPRKVIGYTDDSIDLEDDIDEEEVDDYDEDEEADVDDEV